MREWLHQWQQNLQGHRRLNRRRRARRGMNLLEVMVALTIAIALVMVAGYFYADLAGVKEYRAVNGLITNYRMAQRTADVENVVFRMALHLDENRFVMESGTADTLIFNDPEKRKAFEEELAEAMKRKNLRKPSNADDGDQLDESGQRLEEEKFTPRKTTYFKEVSLPPGVRFGGVYTPQYGEYLEPSDDEDLEEDERLVAYSYIFPGGRTEHTVIQIVRTSQPNFGFTIEIEPLSGRIHIDPELRDWDEGLQDIPDAGPELY